MVKFMVFGDLHYDEMPDGDRRIAEMLVHIKETKPDFVISLGDLCKPVASNQEKILNKFSSIGVPLYHVIGNHETDDCYLEKVLELYSLEKSYYSFEFGGIKFIVLNSCYLSKNGKEYSYHNKNYKEDEALYPIIPTDEMEWLKRELKESKKYVIFSHHSLVNDYRDRGISNRNEIRELFKNKDVLLCMNGHDHGDDFKEVLGIPYYTVNSASYVWCGFQIMSSEKLRKKYEHLKGYLFYKQALYVDVEIDDNEIKILGMNGEYMSVTPDDVELYDYRWNGVSIKPQTSSHIIKRDLKID